MPSCKFINEVKYDISNTLYTVSSHCNNIWSFICKLCISYMAGKTLSFNLSYSTFYNPFKYTNIKNKSG